MVLRHIAAILLFSGPLFYIGLWMAIDPAGFATIPELVLGVFRLVVRTLIGLPLEDTLEPEDTFVPRRLRTGLRFAGVALVLFAIVI